MLASGASQHMPVEWVEFQSALCTWELLCENWFIPVRQDKQVMYSYTSYEFMSMHP